MTDSKDKSSKSRVDIWFECLKIVFHLYKINKKQLTKSNQNPNFIRDIEHYYVSIIQEEMPFCVKKNLGKEEISEKNKEFRKLGLW
jgi:hypothetical protein